MQSKGCFRISKKRRKNEEKMRKYVALAPRKAVALNLTSWCHMCRSLKTLMPCSAPSTWKRCSRNCVIPCVSNIPWSEIFSGSVSESRMTYCQILVLYLTDTGTVFDTLTDTSLFEMQKRIASSYISFQTFTNCQAF